MGSLVVTASHLNKLSSWGTGALIDVVVSGDLAYVSANGAGINIYDISDSANPVLVGNVDTPGSSVDQVQQSARDLFLSGDRLYVADGLSGLTIIDVSQPTNPVFVSNFTTGLGNGVGVVVEGSTAFLSNGFQVWAIDISNELL